MRSLVQIQQPALIDYLERWWNIIAMQTKTKLRYDKFVNEYVKTGNATQSAIHAGYSAKTADVKGSSLLKVPYILDRINEHQQILKENAIADETEILSYYTDVMRGNQEDEVALPTGVYKVKATTKDRIKAGEMLGKHYAMWTDKRSIDANIAPVKIIDDVPECEEEGGQDE